MSCLFRCVTTSYHPTPVLASGCSRPKSLPARLFVCRSWTSAFGTQTLPSKSICAHQKPTKTSCPLVCFWFPSCALESTNRPRMEPADIAISFLYFQGWSDRMESTLEGEGTLHCQHQSQFEAVQPSLGALSASMTNMVPSWSISATPCRVISRYSWQPQLQTPYTGEPASCRSFLSQCFLVFLLQPSLVPTDHSRVAYIITLLVECGVQLTGMLTAQSVVTSRT